MQFFEQLQMHEKIYLYNLFLLLYVRRQLIN